MGRTQRGCAACGMMEWCGRWGIVFETWFTPAAVTLTASFRSTNIRHGVFTAVGLCDVEDFVVWATDKLDLHASVRAVPALLAIFVLHHGVLVVALANPVSPDAMT